MKSLAEILTFILVAYGLAWLVSLPLWLSGGLDNPFFLPLSVAIMFTPTVATVVTRKLFRAGAPLGLLPDKGSVRRIALYSLLGIGLALGCNLGALVVGQAFGLFQADLVHFSAFESLIIQKLGGQPLPASMPPIPVIVILQLLMVVLSAPINAIAALGEEIGWRGWLLPRLMPLGTGPAIVISGIIWGAWHAPLLLLGYNYPNASPWLSLTCMSGMCIALGAMLAWLRLRTNSIWPCALFHGAINAGAGIYLLLGSARHTVDLTQTTILGWSGWIIPLLLAMVLCVTLPPRRSVLD